MSSSNALAGGGGGGGGVAWQVDLPGLASLVLNLGAAGLKRFAEAGVDFHTILCMGEIAEKCPASNEYRRELSVCRQAQRKQAQWLYKVVEIGAATNFVADELLKKRAGENIVALMSAILPVMSESACDNLLLKLFEACKTPLDKTPGFGQLRSIRESLTPLARKTLFKDKAFQYHVLARQLLNLNTSVANSVAYDSIPSEETAVRVILTLSRLIQEDQECKIAYHGLKGSGWVIAYARHVLGLPVCVLSSDTQSVPISGDYHSARVLVYLHKEENKCEILLERKVQDFFVTESLPADSQAGWQIHVEKTNVLDLYITDDPPLRIAISIIARTLAESFVEVLAVYLGREKVAADWMSYEFHVAQIGLTRYPSYCLPTLRKRAEKILTLFGFEPRKASSTQGEDWSDYLNISAWIPWSYGDDTSQLHLVAGPAWIRSKLGLTTHASSAEATKRMMDALGISEDQSFNDEGRAQLTFVFKAVEAACWLAFTDWDQHLRMLSTSFLEDVRPWDECFVFKRSVIDMIRKMGVSRHERQHSATSRCDAMTDLINIVMDVSIGGRQTWTPNFSEDNLLAFHHCGLVFVQNAALHQKLDLQSQFVHMLPGGILVNGERQNKIYSYSVHQHRTQFVTSSNANRQRRLAPTNLFSGISFSTRLEIAGEDVILQQSALVKDKLCAIASPGTTAEALARLYVTKECEHRYDTSFEPEKAALSRRSPLSLKNVKQGLYVAGAPENHGRSELPAHSELWLQAVDQNSAGQWLAYQAFGSTSSKAVLQRDCCVECTWKRIEETISKMKSVGTWKIIHGRLTGEDM